MSADSPSKHRRSASFSEKSVPAVPSFSASKPPVVREIEVNGWAFRSIRSSISSASQIEALSHKIGFPLPTMFFGSNRVEISGPNGFHLHFDPIEAIHCVSHSADSVPVQIAAARNDFWRKKSEEEQIFDYDWTFTPQSYTGSLEGYASINTSPSTGINYARLKQQDPILFFDENILYEDELGDNGISIILIKIRVMEYGFLILWKHFLRVDQVTFRADSCRYYHEFGQPVVIREQRHCEDSFEAVASRLVLQNANFKDNDAVIQTLPILSTSTDEIILQ